MEFQSKKLTNKPCSFFLFLQRLVNRFFNNIMSGDIISIAAKDIFSGFFFWSVHMNLV